MKLESILKTSLEEHQRRKRTPAGESLGQCYNPFTICSRNDMSSWSAVPHCSLGASAIPLRKRSHPVKKMPATPPAAAFLDKASMSRPSKP